MRMAEGDLGLGGRLGAGGGRGRGYEAWEGMGSDPS